MAAEPSSATSLHDISTDLTQHAAFLRMLAGLYFKPLTQEQIDALDADAFHTLALTSEDALSAEGYNDIWRFLRRRDTGTRQVLNVDFTGAFYGASTYEGLCAEPYESLYTNAEGVLIGPARDAAFHIYKDHGMKVQEGLDLPDDHLTFELEFLAALCDRATQALQAADAGAAKEEISLARDFSRDHVCNWFNRFFNLSNKLLTTRFYRGVNKIAKAFLLVEPDYYERLEDALLAA